MPSRDTNGFRLFFETAPVATVQQEDCELLTIMGAYELVPTFRSDTRLQPAVAWHDLCVNRAAQCGSGRGERGSDDRETELQATLEASRWTLMDPQGTELSISLPRFLTRNKMVWRWRAGEEG